ncbi:MAG: M28 family peptidase [Planctomycetes bacterium]|nr:M28 family peptidase [Planctomycetota bacterium]
MRRLVVSCTLALLVVAGSLAWGEVAPEVVTRLTSDLKYLASDELEGRGVGTNGLNVAADYVAKAFKDAGLNVTTAGGDPFQEFTMTTGAQLGPTNTLNLVGPGGKRIELAIDKDFQVCSFGASGTINAELVFGGYAIDAKDDKYQDLEGTDVKGKVLVVIRKTPRQGDPHGPFAAGHGGQSRHADLRSKISNAFGRGAAAILFVNDVASGKKEIEQAKQRAKDAAETVVDAAAALLAADANNAEAVKSAREKLDEAVKKVQQLRDAVTKVETDVLMKFGYAGFNQNVGGPIFHVTQAAVDQVLQASLKKTLAALEAEIDQDLKPRTAVLTGWKAEGQASVELIKTEVKNVIAVIEGQGALAEETVIIGAHYDHIGFGGQNSLAPGVKDVHNGADDNGSGTVSLIELARRFGARKEPLKRRLVFIAFTAEESGLIGSARYCTEPIYPLDKTIAMINMDMVGRLKDEKLIVYGTGTAPHWKTQLERLNGASKFELVMKPEGFGPSDQSSFYGKKIPVLHFFTGTHGEYHRPGDDWNLINYPGMARVVDMIEQVTLETVQSAEKPQYVEVKGSGDQAQARSGSSRPYFGSIPDLGNETPGYALSGVAGGGPADKGGIKGGDVIVEFGKNKISNLDDFDLALRKFKAGEEVEVIVLRKGERVTLKVTLGQSK